VNSNEFILLLKDGRKQPKYIKIKIHRAIILPFILYGHKEWSLTLWKEQSMRVSKNRQLRRICEPKEK
jgi:hypothetical protein